MITRHLTQAGTRAALAPGEPACTVNDIVEMAQSHPALQGRQARRPTVLSLNGSFYVTAPSVTSKPAVQSGVGMTVTTRPYCRSVGLATEWADGLWRARYVLTLIGSDDPRHGVHQLIARRQGSTHLV